MIRVSDLRFRYAEGGFELRIPELAVAAGECVGVIGPSGSGKTTLLHLIAGIARPEAGVVRTNGVAVTELGDAERRAFRRGHGCGEFRGVGHRGAPTDLVESRPVIIACLDLEGVLVPEVWINVAERTGIEALRRTTRDEPDYDVLMRGRLEILAEHGLGIAEIQDAKDDIDDAIDAYEAARPGWQRG